MSLTEKALCPDLSALIRAQDCNYTKCDAEETSGNSECHISPDAEKSFESMGFSKNNFIQLSKTMAELDFSLDLGRLTCPAFIVCGVKDSANKKASEELARRIPGAAR